MTMNTKYLDKVSKPDIESRHKHTSIDQFEKKPTSSRLAIHHFAGNLAIQHTLREGAQAELSVQQPRDIHEQKVSGTQEQESGLPQDNTLRATHQPLSGLGSGIPLDLISRALMESRFGHDFRGVRLHTDTKAAQ